MTEIESEIYTVLTSQIMSLYRNYRPKDFPSLIGQEHISVTLLNAIRSGQIAHAYLFTGPRGTGKTTTARLMAKAINAETMTEDGRFDGSEIAEEIDAGRLIDVIEIDAASNRGIDEIRDLREKINYSPTRAKNKVYIIDEVHMLTKEAFNALLKTLEEPPSFVYFILATTEINKVPETIISRCQRFDFKRITDLDILNRLKYVCDTEGFMAEEEALKIVARQSRGGMRDALSLLEQLVSDKKLSTENVKKVLGMSNFASIEAMYCMIKGGKAADAMEEVNKLFMSGADLVQFNKDFLDYLRGEMLEMVKTDNITGAKWIIGVIGNFQDAYEKQKYSYIPELPLEVAIVKAAMGEKMAEIRSDSQNEGSKKKPEEINGTKTVNILAATVPVVENKVEAKQDISAQMVESSETKQELVAGEISVEQIIQKWTSLLDRIHHPLARRCLASGKPIAVEGTNLVLGFSSNFNKDKLFVPELLQESEKAIREEFGKNLSLVGKVDESLFANLSAATVPAKAEVKENILNSALNAFGGQVME